MLDATCGFIRGGVFCANRAAESLGRSSSPPAGTKVTVFVQFDRSGRHEPHRPVEGNDFCASAFPRPHPNGRQCTKTVTARGHREARRGYPPPALHKKRYLRAFPAAAVAWFRHLFEPTWLLHDPCSFGAQYPLPYAEPTLVIDAPGHAQ